MSEKIRFVVEYEELDEKTVSNIVYDINKSNSLRCLLNVCSHFAFYIIKRMQSFNEKITFEKIVEWFLFEMKKDLEHFQSQNSELSKK